LGKGGKGHHHSPLVEVNISWVECSDSRGSKELQNAYLKTMQDCAATGPARVKKWKIARPSIIAVKFHVDTGSMARSF